MPDTSPAIGLLSRLAPVLVEWKRAAIAEWLTQNPPEMRVSLSRTERNRFIFDRTMARAEVAVLPVRLAKVRTEYGLRWLYVEDDGVRLAIWFKKIDPKTLLTSNYPTLTAQRRQREPYLPYEDFWAELYVCGHTISENLAGDVVEMTGIYFTQERMENETRYVSDAHRVYSSQRGNLPMPALQQLTLWQPPPMQPAQARPTPPIVRAKLRPAAAAENATVPKAGIDRPKRAAEQQAKRRKKDNLQGA